MIAAKALAVLTGVRANLPKKREGLRSSLSL